MGLTYRSIKGSKLTKAEGDDNTATFDSRRYATQFNLVKDFGCKNDGIAFTGGVRTNGSANLVVSGASFTSADIGKCGYDRGGGNLGNGYVEVWTIVSVTNSTTVVTSTTAQHSSSSCMGVYGTDNTAMLQAWADSVASSSNVFNTETYAPAGIYCIAGGFGTYHGQIEFPRIASNNSRRYRLVGDGPCEVGYDAYDNSYTTNFHKSWIGTVFLSCNGAATGNQWAWTEGTDAITTFNICYGTPIFEGLTIRTLGDYGHIGGVYAYRSANFKGRDLSVDHDVIFGKFVNAPDFSNTRCGITMPAPLNDADNTLHNVLTAGFSVGVDMYEHCNGDNLMVFGCLNGIRLNDSGHQHSFGRVLAQWNKWQIGVTGVYANPSAPTQAERVSINISQLEIELDPDSNSGTRWYNNAGGIYDPNRRGSGRISFHQQQGTDVLPFTISRTDTFWDIHDISNNYTAHGGYDASKMTVNGVHTMGRVTSDALLADNYANDAAAAVGGIKVGGTYHTSGAQKVRLT